MPSKHTATRSITGLALMMLTGLLLLHPASASDVKYSYAKLRYVNQELGDINSSLDADNLTGFEIGASFQVKQNLFIFADLEKTASEIRASNKSVKGSVDTDFQQIEAGLGYIHPLNNNWDVNAAVSFIRGDSDRDEATFSGPGGTASLEAGSEDDNGFMLKAGVRGMLTSRFEARSFLNYDDIAEDTYVSFGADFLLTDNISLGGDISFGDTRLALGGKFNF